MGTNKNIIINKVEKNSIKLNRLKFFEEYSCLRIDSTPVNVENKYKDFDFTKLFNFVSSEAETENTFKKNLLSIYKNDSSLFVLIKNNGDKNVLIDHISSVLEENKKNYKLTLEDYFFENRDYYNLINLLIASLVHVSAFNPILNTSFSPMFYIFLDENEKNCEKNLVFLNAELNNEYVLEYRLSTFMKADYYYTLTNDLDEIKDSQKLYRILPLIKSDNDDNPINCYIQDLPSYLYNRKSDNPFVYIKRSRLNSNDLSAKKNVVTEFDLNIKNTDKVKMLLRIFNGLKNFYGYYIDLNFKSYKVMTEDDDSSAYYNEITCRDFDKSLFKEAMKRERDTFLNKIKNHKIIFIDTINDEDSKAWVNEQVKLLKDQVYGTSAGVDCIELFTNIDELRDDAYNIVITKDKSQYNKDSDPYLKFHGNFIVQHQNIGAVRKVKDKKTGKIIRREASVKDILRQTLFSLIIEEDLMFNSCSFPYNDNICFYKIFPFGEDICVLTISINKDTRMYKDFKLISNLSVDNSNSTLLKALDYYNGLSNKSYYEYSAYYGGNLYHVNKTNIKALPDFNSLEEAWLNSDMSKSGVLSRKRTVIDSLYGGLTDLQCFILDGRFFFMPSVESSKSVRINGVSYSTSLQSKIERNCVAREVVTDDGNPEAFFNFIKNDFMSFFTNSKKIATNPLSTKYLNEYFKYLEREGIIKKE